MHQMYKIHNVFQPAFSYSQAEKDCTSRGMNLVSVLNKLEENFILQTVDNDPSTSVNIWIGFRKKGEVIFLSVCFFFLQSL